MGLCGIAALFLAVLLASEKVESRRLSCPSKTTLATFNTGFVLFYPGTDGSVNPELDERVQLLIEQIENSDVDVFCLQEVFFMDIQQQIYNALSQKYPYILSAADLSAEVDPTPACTPQELQELVVCIATQCSGLEGNVGFVCASNLCGGVVNSETFSPICRDCISNYLFIGQPEQCLALPSSRFVTTYGLMLLSKKELTNTRASGFNNQSQFRGYLEASVDGVGDLVCTHLTSYTPNIYFGPPIVSPLLYSSSDQQQYDEILTLFDVVTSSETPILMGDLNNGPASPGENFAWELPFHYGLIAARGFVSPYVLRDGRCTFCVDNPNVNFESNIAIDHIYLTTNTYEGRVISAERFLDNVMTASGSSLSDHYGVKVTLKDIQSNCRWWENRLYYCPQSPRLQLNQLSSPLDQISGICAIV